MSVNLTAQGRWILATAALLIALATILGAFGAHGLQGKLAPDRLAIYETAVRYHYFHTLGLLAIGLAACLTDSRAVVWSAGFVIAGVVLFSGSIYALSFGAPRLIGVVTPIGGLALMIGWPLFAFGIAKATRP